MTLVTLFTSYTGTRFRSPGLIGMITLGVLVWLKLFSVEENAPEDIEVSKARSKSITNDEKFLA